MTESKRYSFNWERGHPQFWDNHCDLADCYLTCEDVCELLNKLNDENKTLDLSEELDYYKTKCASLETGLFQADKENERLKSICQDHREHANDFKADCVRLEKEKEELKENCKNYNWYKQYKTLLNENEQLKSDNNRLVNETAKIIGEHQRKVFDLIDEKVDELEKRYKFGQEVYKGCPMHNIRFGINTLKELKKELQE